MKLTCHSLFPLIAGLSFAATLAASRAAPEVELLVDGDELLPTSTLEIRFARDMINREQVGVTVANSPFTIQPACPGKFTWLSRRSGVFVPTEPPRMGTTFAVGLLGGLKDEGGKPIGAKFRATLKTPPFDVSDLKNGVSDPKAAPALPEVRMAFNREVKLDGSEKLIRFIDDAGKSVAATVRHAIQRDYYSIAPEAEDWDQRWRLGQQASLETEAEEGDEEEEEAPNQEPIRNRFIVKPAEPLAPGHVWRLEMKAGLEALSGDYRIRNPRTVVLGRVQPFTLKSLVTSSYLNNGRSVAVTFSDELAPDVDDDTAAKFFRVAPEVTNLKFVRDYQGLTIRGDFDRETEYRFEIDPSLLSNDGLPLSGERVRPFRFDPVKPRIFLPEITGIQILGGRLQFPVLSTNLKALHVIARLVTPDKAPQAIDAFAKYNKDYDPKAPDEIYQPIAPGVIPGEVIADRTFALSEVKIDARQEKMLDWDELLGARKAGLIFLTVEGQPLDAIGGTRPGAQALIQLTDLGVLWKKVADKLNVTVFSMATGKPMSGAQITLLDEAHAPISRGQSDAEGNAALPAGAKPKCLIVRHGEDQQTVRMGYGRELPMAAFGETINYDEWEGEDPDRPELRGLIFTDRPLYRPGEIVHVKGIIRDVGATGLAAETERDGILHLYQPNGRGEKEIKIRTDLRGAFDTQIALDSSATGGYSLRSEFSGQGSFYAHFQTADFQPNAFELNIAAPARFAPDAEIAAEVSARYFFGSSLGKSSVRWTLQYSPEEFAPEGFVGFTFGIADRPEQKSLTLHDEGVLSEAGTFVIRPKLPAVQDRPSRGRYTVEVTDLNQQTVSESRMFTRDAAEFYLGLKMPEEYVIGHEQEVVARAVAVRPDGEALAEPLEVKAELVRVRYETVRVQGAGKAIAFHTETREEVADTKTGRTLVPTRRGRDWEFPAGETARFKPEKAGRYLLRVSAKDKGGRTTVASFGFNVSGTEAVAWDYRNPAQVDLVADKPEYRAGDKARILVKTPISGEALITIERGSRILRTQRVQLAGNAPTFDIPIEAGDAPNVFVSLMLIRGAEESTRKFKVPEYRYSVCRLNVGDPSTHLKVEVSPTVDTVQPGDEVATDVRIHDGNGTAVADAEVTFFAVDDGVLAITGYERPQPRTAFEAPFPLAIRTGVSLYELMPEDPADLEFANKGYLIGGGGIEGPGPKLRHDFPGTACWFPALRTDKDGLVTVRFKAPDALTRYRLVAVAHAGRNRFGSGESAFSIRKKLMILSALGQVANVGDEIVARAVVRNESGTDGTADVALTLDATAVPPAQPLAAKLALKNGEARTVDFPVRLRAMGDAGWKWTAKMEAGGKSFEDAIAATLKIGSPALVLRETYLTDLANTANDLLDGVNPQLLEGEGAVRVTLSNTRLASLRGMASALLEYPYGCAEQTVSSLVPWITLNELGPVLLDLGKNKQEARETIRAGIDKIFALQISDGGLAYWPGGHRANFFASAYAVIALSMLEKQGEELPEGWAKLLEYVSSELRGLGDRRAYFNLDDAAMAVFALASAGKSEPAYHEQLYARRAELPLESRALLALAMMETGGSAKAVGTLLDPRIKAPDAFSWFGGASRERAIELMAWVRFKPNDREVARLVKELLAGRRHGGCWCTTQQNAWAMMALSRYFTNVEHELAPVDGTVVKAGVEAPFALTKTDLTKTMKFAFDPERPLGALEVRNPDKRNLYGEANFVVRPPVADQPRQDRGYAVSRSYKEIAADGSLRDANDLQVGDRVLVTLRLETPRPGHFVAIDDPLPAIFEAINPEFRTAGGDDRAQAPWAADYQEIRADRVLYFCDHLPAGAFTFRYLARVRTAGKVTAPATKVEEMYRPERFGLSATAKIESHAAE
jgi:uncharacterized protein YfaS (alpha-2-macroglobulin family)